MRARSAVVRQAREARQAIEMRRPDNASTLRGRLPGQSCAGGGGGGGGGKLGVLWVDAHPDVMTPRDHSRILMLMFSARFLERAIPT